jgi:plasmid stabilization system protein ParE
LPGFLNGSMICASFRFLGRIEANCARRCEGLLVEGYVVFYMVEVDRIIIVRVIDGRKDIEQEFSK